MILRIDNVITASKTKDTSLCHQQKVMPRKKIMITIMMKIYMSR
jgi:hypothetical protein